MNPNTNTVNGFANGTLLQGSLIQGSLIQWRAVRQMIHSALTLFVSGSWLLAIRHVLSSKHWLQPNEDVLQENESEPLCPLRRSYLVHLTQSFEENEGIVERKL